MRATLNDPHAAERARLAAELGGDRFVAKASFPIEEARKIVARTRAMVRTATGGAYMDEARYRRELAKLNGHAPPKPATAPSRKPAARKPESAAQVLARADRTLRELGYGGIATASTSASSPHGLRPNPELDRMMGLAPTSGGTSFDPKSQALTLGAPKAAAHFVHNGKKAPEPAWMKQVREAERLPPPREETPEEAKRRRERLDRETGLAESAGCALSKDKRIFTFGVRR